MAIPRIPGAATRLVALAAVACLVLALQRAGRRPIELAGPTSGPAPSLAGTRHEVVGPRRAAVAGDDPSDTARAEEAFVETGSIDHLDGLRDEPGFAPAWHRQQQRIIERQYGYAVDSLNLPESEAARLRDLLTARREAVADGRDAAARMGIVGPQANAAVKQSVDELTGEIVELVGPDAYFGRIELAPTVSTCESLIEGAVGADLASKGDPMTRDQLYSLAEAYVDAAYSPGSADDAQSGGPSGLTPRLQALLDRVSGQVSPAQAEAVRAFLFEQARASRALASSSPQDPEK
jgi:hypothetical protein